LWQAWNRRLRDPIWEPQIAQMPTHPLTTLKALNHVSARWKLTGSEVPAGGAFGEWTLKIDVRGGADAPPT
jgi:hypothetical protein